MEVFLHGECSKNKMQNKYQRIVNLIYFYPKVGKVKKIDSIYHNNINSTNHLIKTTNGDYVLRNFTDGSSPQKIENMCQILNNCYKKRIKVQKPIKNKIGSYVLKKEKVYITEYYKGNTFSGSKNEFMDVARNLAKLHKILEKDLTNYKFYSNDSSYEILTHNEINRIKKKVITKNDYFDSIVNNKISYIENAFDEIIDNGKNLKKKSRKQLIHHDIHPQNVIFKKGKVVAFIDFNSIRRGYKIEDVGFTCFRFSIFKFKNIEYLKNRMDLFFEEYKKFGNIDECEMDLNCFYLKQKLLKKISFILRNRYFNNSNIWLSDFQKNLKYLKILEKL